MDALALLVGVTAIQFAPALPAHWPAAAVTLVLLAPLAWRTRWRPLLFLALGLVYATARAQLDLDHRLPAGEEPYAVRAILVIDSLVELRGQAAAFEARVLHMDASLHLRRVRIDWYWPPATLRAGQSWQVSLTLRRPRGLRNPHGFDAEGHWLRTGIDALGTVNARSQPHLLPHAPRYSLLQLRESLSRKLLQFAAGNPSAGVITGLAVGDTSSITPELWSLFRASGITHLMAISGTHVGMFAVLAAAITRRGWRWSPWAATQRGSQAACVLAAIVASSGYALLAGFSVPSQRTALMIAVAGLARLRRRHLPATQALALALFAVLLLDPAAGLQPGFWLSFGTVLWIVSLETGVAAAALWRAAAGMQLRVSLLVLPVCAYCFGQASLIAAPVNLIAMPLTGMVIVPLILLAAALSVPAPGLAQQIIAALAAGLDWLWPLLAAIASWPGAQWWSSALPLSLAVFATLAAACAGMLPVLHWRLLAAAAMYASLSWRPAQPAAAGFEFTMLDAGDATLGVLLTQRATIVYFAGSGHPWARDLGAAVLLPHLRARGRRRIDLLFVSRADAGNAAGIDTVFREIPVLQTFGGADPRAPCFDGQSFDRDGVAIRLWGPLAEQAAGRDASCVLWFGTARGSVLLAGEISQRQERALLERRAIRPVTLALVPSRGSHLSSSPAYVATLRPRWAVIGAAYLNRFGYPRPEVMVRWEQAGATVRQVSLEGAMTLEVPAQGPVRLAPGERLARPRYWAGN